MNRKKGISPMQVIIGIVLALLLFTGAMLAAGKEKEKFNDLSGYETDVLQTLQCVWGCKCLGVADFSQFMKNMSAVFTACDKNNKCEYQGCVTVNLDFPGGPPVKGPDGRYAVVDGNVLKSWKLDAFNNYAWKLPLGPNVYCERDDADWGDYEIDPYYTGPNFAVYSYTQPLDLLSKYVKYNGVHVVDVCDSTLMSPPFTSTNGAFAVADGSAVTIKATRHEDSILSGYTGSSIDLNVKVVGGVYTNKVSFPSPPCTSNPECQPPAWGTCQTGKCEYSYCKTPGAKCKLIPPTCTLSTTDSPFEQTCTSIETVCGGASYFNPVPNGYKTKILGLQKTSTGYTIGFKVSSSENSIPLTITDINEGWFRDPGLVSPSSWYTNAMNENAKVSLGVDYIKESPPGSGNYDVKIHQGCY